MCRKLTIISILITLMVLILSFGYFFSPERPFNRIPFEICGNFNVTPLKFNKKTFSWNAEGEAGRNILAKDITRGTGMEIQDFGALRAYPESHGKKGIQFTLYQYSPEKKMHVDILFKRDDYTYKKIPFRLKRKKFTRSIHEIIDFKSGDEILIEAKGRGAFIISDLLVYDIVPLPERDYIFIIALDNLRHGKIGAKRNGVLLTPALNQLRRDAVFFSNAFAQSSWTYPSFMSLFSGIYEHKLNLERDAYLSCDIPFLVESIAEKFITVNFNGGAWMQAKYGTSRGFDIIQSPAGAETHSSGNILLHEAIEYLQNNPVPRLMMFLHTYQVHSPFIPRAEILHQINPSPEFTNLRNYTGEAQFKCDVSAEKRNALIELYEAEVMEFDHYLQQFIQFLKKSGIYDRSMIVFLSDHGEEFYEHSGWYHGHSLYNELVKVPLMIKFPGKEIKPRIFPHYIGLLDIFPTLMDYHNIDTPKNINGASLMPAIHSGATPERDIYFSTSCCIFDHLPPKAGFIQGSHKVIFNFPFSQECWEYFHSDHKPLPLEPVEIYDLKTDPKERYNLIKTHPEMLSKFREKLNRVIKEIQQNKMIEAEEKVELSEKDKEELSSLGYLR